MWFLDFHGAGFFPLTKLLWHLLGWEMVLTPYCRVAVLSRVCEETVNVAGKGTFKGGLGMF